MISIEEKAREIGLDEQLILELYSEFVEQSHKDLNALKDGLCNGDPNRVVQTAHSIKGAASNLRADEIAALSKRIEELARSDNLTEVQGPLGDLEALFEELKIQLASSPEPKTQ